MGFLTKGKPQMMSVLKGGLERQLNQELSIDSEGRVELPGANGLANTLLCFVAQDKRAEPRLRSFNLTGFLIDEATTLPFGMIAAANARMRVGDPKGLLLTNPDGPRHPLKLNYFDKPEKMFAQTIYSELRDNPVITEAYIASLRASYSGHMLERMVNGRWTAASGLVYPHFLEVTGMPDPETFVAKDVVIDVGESSVTHALLTARTVTGETWIIDECRHHHIEEGVLDDREMIAKIRRAFSGHDIYSWIVDPAALGFRQALATQLRRVGKAYNDWEEGVEEVNHWIGVRALRIWAERVPHLMAELGALVWDEDASEKGKDVPVATPDHGADALRYLVLTRTIHEMGGRKAWEIKRKRQLEEAR